MNVLRKYIRMLFEANTYGWKVSSHKSMMLDKEGMPQRDKDNQEAYLKLMGLMESAHANDMSMRTILIPPPPSLDERLKELPRITAQYENNVNAPEMQNVLDIDSSPLYNAIIVAEGYPDVKDKIKNVLDSVKPVILAHKEHFSALRPNELAEAMGISFEFDYLESAQTSSYPSGHATQAYYVAHVLSDIYPSLSEEFFTIAEMVSQSRIDRGVHFPSDIEAGKQLAAAVHGIVKG
jgi:hypothetical protein